MIVYNWIGALIPFALFCFIAIVLTKRRFTSTINIIVWCAAILTVTVPHVVVFAGALDTAKLLTLMPVTAYLPIAVVYFVLSKHNFVSNIFAVLFGALCAVSVVLISSLFTAVYTRYTIKTEAFVPYFDITKILAYSVAAGLLGFFVFRYLRKVFQETEALSDRLWYILPAIFLLLLASLWRKDSTNDIAFILIILLLDVSVFCIITAFIYSRNRQKEIEKDKAIIEKQLEAEREKYLAMRQTAELGKRYRHDMRHHLSLIQEMVKGGNSAEINDYVEGLNNRLTQTEAPEYCKSNAINALLSMYAEKAQTSGVDFNASIALPEKLFVDEIDLCALISNALENAANACEKISDAEKYIQIFTEFSDERLSVTVKNSVEKPVELGDDGLPVYEKTEIHGYGLSSIQYIAKQYGGMIKVVAAERCFTLVAVMFRRPPETIEPGTRSPRNILRCAAIVPAVLVVSILTLNSMPGTLDTLEQIQAFGKAIEIIDFRTYGWSWGDSELDIKLPVTDNSDADKVIERYAEECRERFKWYYAKKYNGYVGTEFTSRELVNDDEIYVVRMSCILYAGSSAEYFRYFVVDKRTNQIVDLRDLFLDGSDYEKVLVDQILRQMEERVEENGDFFFGFGIWDDEPKLSELKDANFYLDENHSLVIVFDEQEVAPGNMGSPSFTISYSAIENIIAENSLLKGGV